jgi:hypothetical protein
MILISVESLKARILELQHPSDRRIEKNEELLASYIDTWEASLADHIKRQVSDS